VSSIAAAGWIIHYTRNLHEGNPQKLLPQGNVKVNPEPVAFVTFYNTIKSKISSTKLQINLNIQ
jgi:hypothetical protein